MVAIAQAVATADDLDWTIFRVSYLTEKTASLLVAAGDWSWLQLEGRFRSEQSEYGSVDSKGDRRKTMSEESPNAGQLLVRTYGSSAVNISTWFKYQNSCQ
jgi:hypothetical protein